MDWVNIVHRDNSLLSTEIYQKRRNIWHKLLFEIFNQRTHLN